MSARPLKFRTPDVQFGLSVDETMMDKILKLYSKAGNAETGGILVGHYTKRHDWAIVTDVSGPPDDSKRGRASFYRGIKGLQTWLNQIWGSKRHYYLGEWHYHPFASLEASSIDERQLQEHSENGPLVCPEPVMLIVGGNPNGAWEAKAYVYPKGRKLLPMDHLETDVAGHGVNI
jgi:integrative and conjugative element protein (TIGR02256 family)